MAEVAPRPELLAQLQNELLPLACLSQVLKQHIIEQIGPELTDEQLRHYLTVQLHFLRTVIEPISHREFRRICQECAKIADWNALRPALKLFIDQSPILWQAAARMSPDLGVQLYCLV